MAPIAARVAMLALMSIGASARAQTPPPPPPGENAAIDSARAARGKTLQVSLITYGPSDEVWERFGHDAIGVKDSITGEDVAYNWGVFHFDQPNFIWKFLTGDTKYAMEGYPTPDYNDVYRRENRTIRVQRIALTPVERAAMQEFLAWNASEANKYYRYDYYRDNCATRVRDAFDRVLKGRLKVALDSGSVEQSWRSETERAYESDLPTYAGIELALGRNADQKSTRWANSFVPERLAEAIESLVLRNDQGLRYKLVASDSLIATSTRIPIPIDAPDRLAMAALLGLTLAGMIAFLADSRFALLRRVLVIGIALWYVVGGILGTALLLAATVTKHAPYMGSNNTLWQISPLLLFAAVVIPISLSRRQASRNARILSVLILAFSFLGLLLQFIPSLSQRSGVVIAVILPVNVAIAIAISRLSTADRPRSSGAAVMARVA